MFDEEFFPTPNSVACRMLEPYSAEELRNMIILEPSAGKGDLLDAIHSKAGERESQKSTMYAIEKVPELRTILAEKGYKVVGSDFFDYEAELPFDLIVMNPPFSNGEEHVLRAFDILKDGDVVALLNAETLKNPYSKRRKLLLSAIESHGSWENLGPVFRNAERTTNVEVALVRLSKKSQVHDFDFGMNSEELKFKEDSKPQDLATRNQVENICILHKKAVEAFYEGMQKIHEAYDLSKSISSTYACDPFKVAGEEKPPKVQTETFNSQIKMGIWSKIAEELNIEKYMTQDLKSNFYKYLRQHSASAINPGNIFKFFDLIMSNRHTIMESAISEVFDIFTRYYKENRVYIEGWKTNDRWKVNKKVILPYGVVYEDYSGKMRLNFSQEGKYNDIDKVLAYISAQSYEKCLTIADAIEEAFRKGEMCATSTFFKIRAYKKGTLHLEFLDDWLWKEFNYKACLNKKWLPEGEIRKETSVI